MQIKSVKTHLHSSQPGVGKPAGRLQSLNAMCKGPPLVINSPVSSSSFTTYFRSSLTLPSKMGAFSPFWASILLLITITTLSSIVHAARYNGQINLRPESEASELQRTLFQDNLAKALRGQHEAFPLIPFENARVGIVDTTAHPFNPEGLLLQLKNRGDEPRYVILDHPFPGDMFKKGFSAAALIGTYPNVPHRSLFGIVSAVDTTNSRTGAAATPRIDLHGYSVVDNAPDLETRFLALNPGQGPRQRPMIDRGSIVTLRELMTALPNGMRP